MLKHNFTCIFAVPICTTLTAFWRKFHHWPLQKFIELESSGTAIDEISPKWHFSFHMEILDGRKSYVHLMRHCTSIAAKWIDFNGRHGSHREDTEMFDIGIMYIHKQNSCLVESRCVLIIGTNTRPGKMFGSTCVLVPEGKWKGWNLSNWSHLVMIIRRFVKHYGGFWCCTKRIHKITQIRNSTKACNITNDKQYVKGTKIEVQNYIKG